MDLLKKVNKSYCSIEQQQSDLPKFGIFWKNGLIQIVFIGENKECKYQLIVCSKNITMIDNISNKDFIKYDITPDGNLGKKII
jgi:hypothetical protein